VDNVWKVKIVSPYFIFVGGGFVVWFTLGLVGEIRDPGWVYVLTLALTGPFLVCLWLMSWCTIHLNDQWLAARGPLPLRDAKWSVAVVDIREIRFTDPAGGSPGVGPILILGDGDRILARLPGHMWSKAQMDEIGARLGVPVTGHRRYKVRNPLEQHRSTET